MLRERQGAPAELAARKREVNEYSGVFYYHRLGLGSGLGLGLGLGLELGLG